TAAESKYQSAAEDCGVDESKGAGSSVERGNSSRERTTDARLVDPDAVEMSARKPHRKKHRTSALDRPLPL
ncbi:hypothetical protein FS749_000530, partial [Ceratobasidium sp. UAMH 11750]